MNNELIEALDDWIDFHLSKQDRIVLTLMRARTTIKEQGNRIDELLNALERQKCDMKQVIDMQETQNTNR